MTDRSVLVILYEKRSNVGKKEKIYEAALQVYSEHGYEGSNVEMIAERAGIGKGTIYLYFKGKEDMFMKTIEHAMMSFAEFLNKNICNCNSAAEKLNNYIDGTFSLIVNNHQLARIVVKELPNFTVKMLNDPKVKKRKMFEIRVGTIRNIIEEGKANGEFRNVDTDTIALMILGAVNIYITRFMIEGLTLEQMKINEFKKMLIDILKKED